MKYLLAIIILVIIICQTTQAIAQEKCDFNALDITFEPIATLNGKPVNGTVCAYHDNGNIWVSVSFKEGKEDGMSREYYESGKLAIETPYKNGKIEGMGKKYYESGKPESELQFINGKAEGIAKNYSENGKLWGTVLYKDDKAISGTCSDGRPFTSDELINWENGCPVSCN